MEKRIDILVKEPGKSWEVRNVENTLPAMQKALGGYLECFDHVEKLMFFCDEDGIMKGLTPNIQWERAHFPIRGTVLGIRVNEQSEWTNIDADDAARAHGKFDDGEAAAE